MMLQEFRVDNFKSLINIIFNPHAVNLLLGLNNSGKTNLCQSMRFLAATTIRPLDQCADVIAGSRVGITNYYLDKSTIDFYAKASVPFEKEDLIFEYELVISAPTAPAPDATLEVESEKLVVTGENFDSIVLLRNTRKKVELLHEKDFIEGEKHYIETTAPRDTTMLNRLYDSEPHVRANCFKRYLACWQYCDFSPPALRRSDHTANEFLLNVDGSNLASVIYRLKTSNERDYRRLLKYVQKLEPKIDLINFQVASENNVFMFFEDTEGHSFPAWNASAGTLRFLALTYTLLVQPSLISHPLIIMEEPENGIYVGLLKDLIEMATQARKPVQVIFTSHSPYFVDLFDDRLDSIYILKLNKGHSSIVQPDETKVRKRLEDFPLGEQHFREMLG